VQQRCALARETVLLRNPTRNVSYTLIKDESIAFIYLNLAGCLRLDNDPSPLGFWYCEVFMTILLLMKISCYTAK
jgi:hypothetical protein